MTEIAQYLADIFKFTISGLIVFFTAFYVLRSYLDESRSMKLLELRKGAQTHILPLRLQAYERLILFVERINPSNMLVRLHVSGMTAREMQNMILSDIRAEFQHNTAQQLYITSRSWAIIKRLKEDTISLINRTAATLPEHASSVELSKAILTQIVTIEDNPYDAALTLVKLDIEALFSL